MISLFGKKYNKHNYMYTNPIKLLNTIKNPTNNISQQDYKEMVGTAFIRELISLKLYKHYMKISSNLNNNNNNNNSLLGGRMPRTLEEEINHYFPWGDEGRIINPNMVFDDNSIDYLYQLIDRALDKGVIDEDDYDDMSGLINIITMRVELDRLFPIINGSRTINMNNNNDFRYYTELEYKINNSYENEAITQELYNELNKVLNDEILRQIDYYFPVITSGIRGLNIDHNASIVYIVRKLEELLKIALNRKIISDIFKDRLVRMLDAEILRQLNDAMDIDE